MELKKDEAKNLKVWQIVQFLKIKFAENKYEMEKLVCLLVAAIITVSMHFSFQLFVQKTRMSVMMFAQSSFTDFFVCITVYCMIRYVKMQDKKIDISFAVLSVVFSILYVTSKSYKDFNGLDFFTYSKVQFCLALFCIVGLFMLFYLAMRAMLIYLKNRKNLFLNKEFDDNTLNHIQLFSFLVIFICWLPWIVFNYPGSFCPDAQSQLRQFFGDATFTGHHPPLSTYIMGILVVIGDYVGDKNFGCFLYLLLQTCLGAYIFSLGINKLYLKGFRFRYCLIITLFFALTPVWGCFAQWYEKDFLYTEVTVLFLIYLIDIISKRDCTAKNACLLFLTGLLSSLLRNNGIYAVLPTIFVLAFYKGGKRFRKNVCLSFVSIVLVYVCITKVLYPSVLGIQKGSIKEALSIPFQQTARYVSKYENEVTESEKEAINGVLNYELLMEKYDPVISDSIKGMYKGDNAKLPEYFKVWLKMFLKHPGTYISAFLNGSYGYLAPVATDIEAPVFVSETFSDYPYLTAIGIHRCFGDFFSKIFSYIRGICITFPLVKYLCMPGMYVWIMMICMTVLVKRRKYDILIIFIPEIMNILVCMASPLSNAIRYELPVVAATPFLILWTYWFVFSDIKPAEK